MRSKTATILGLGLFVVLDVCGVIGESSSESSSESDEDDTHCVKPFPENPSVPDLFSDLKNDTDIVKFHNELAKNFNPERIEEIVPGRMYQAIGYTLGFPTVVVGDNGKLIIIDAPESYTEGLRMMADFRNIPAIGNAPIDSIIITLFHGDHIWGLQAFLEDENNLGVTPTIIINDKLPDNLKHFNTFSNFKFPRILRMFGLPIPNEWHLHDGAAERLKIDPKPTDPYPQILLTFPTKDTVLTRVVAGTTLKFYSIPGYTTDSIATYFPSFRVLHGADIFYVAFPNMYTLRGEPARDATKWADDVRTMADVDDVDVMLATHAWPLWGSEIIHDTLTNYSDAMKYVHDQTLRMMMKGHAPDVIAEKMIKLPPSQANQIYLTQSYGLVETSSKAVYAFYVGWFSGRGEDMFPLNRDDRVDNMISWLTADTIMEEACRAYEAGDYRWAMELSSMVYNKDKSNIDAKGLRTRCMLRLAEITPSVLSRHYLLTLIMEDWGEINNPISTRNSLKNMPLDGVFKNLQVHVNSELVQAELNDPLTIYINITSSLHVHYGLTFRNAILDYQELNHEDIPTGALIFHVTEADFRKYLTTTPFPHVGVVTNGSIGDVDNFFKYIDFIDEA